MSEGRHQVVVVGGGFGGVRVTQALAPDGRKLKLPYDTLVVAAGCTDAYFGHAEWAVWAPGLKTPEDASRQRSHILGAFELAGVTGWPPCSTGPGP
jgi:NADH dehydrogenase FAD-containing subunit